MYLNNRSTHFCHISASWEVASIVGSTWAVQYNYDKEAEVDHRCLVTSNIMCLAMIAKCEPLEPWYLKIGGSYLASI